MPEIVKWDGSRELFNIHKLADSLARSGADAPLANSVAEAVGGTVKDGMTTAEIYKEAYRILHKEERVTAARYSMRRAILELGPTGFPFEDYVSELMRAKGYVVKTRVMVAGKCADHEVDVVMEKEGRTIGAELKFHNEAGYKTDIKTALYVRARFTDIDAAAGTNVHAFNIHEGWLITNTKFTDNAISYAQCAGIHLLGWDYPARGNLGDLIRETGLYPVTVLTTLNAAEKSRLLSAQMPLCSTVQDADALRRAGIPEKKIKAAMEESVKLCKIL
jgi:hypothetical protein